MASDASDPPPLLGRRALVVGLLVALFLVWLDQWSKAEVYTWLTGEGYASLERDIHGHLRHPVHGEWLSFMASCNSGAAFGQLGDFPLVLVVGRILACGFLIYMLACVRQGQGLVRWAMVLVLAGAIGNVVDNLATGCGSQGFPYGVRDFIAVWFKPMIGWDSHFPSFNVADACISVGALLWICSGFFGPKEEAPEESAGEQAPS